MEQSNYIRMMALADNVFDVQNDPEQLDVDEDVIKNFGKIHKSAVSVLSNEDGPIAWVLLFPTTSALMNDFLEKKISEKALYELTPFDGSYDAVYLCSAMVLDEFRRQGITKRLTIDAISAIQQDHKIDSLFVWVFSEEGSRTSEEIAKAVSLPLFKRE